MAVNLSPDDKRPAPINPTTLQIPDGKEPVDIDLEVRFISQYSPDLPSANCLLASRKMVGARGEQFSREDQLALMDLSKRKVAPDGAKTKEAAELIVDSIKRGKPVIAGVHRGGNKRPNAAQKDNVTQHYIVIDGVKSDGQGGHIFSTVDPGTSHPNQARGELHAGPGDTTISGDRTYNKDTPTRYAVTSLRTS